MDKKPLIILEMANNHNGSSDHALLIISTYAEICEQFKNDFDFAIKFQYRDLDSYIHPGAIESPEKLVTRFQSTRLSESDFKNILASASRLGFEIICTPFDEKSVERVVDHGYSQIKVASACIDDWPLHEKIATSGKNLPIIISTAGATLDQVDRVVSFYKNRNLPISLLHCVGMYPTPYEFSNLNRIDLLKNRYPNIPIGFSSHEPPTATVLAPMALAKGAKIFEKHVALETEVQGKNDYSTNPEQFLAWLKALQLASKCLEIQDERSYHKFLKIERETLYGLKRAAFSKKYAVTGDSIRNEDVYFAIPRSRGQLGPENFGLSLDRYDLLANIEKDAALFASDLTYIEKFDSKEKIANILHKVKGMLSLAKITLGKDFEVELSHHAGLENFDKVGAVLITVIDRNFYSKKIVVQVPGQQHPEHFHPQKEESFQVLWGDGIITVNGKSIKSIAGDIHHVLPGEAHSFSTEVGWILEEVATKSIRGDSRYVDHVAQNRKTNIKDLWLTF